MEKTLTEKQSKILNYIRDYQKSSGKSPTFDEIRKSFRFSSLNSVYKHINALEQKEYIVRSNNSARGIELLPDVKKELFEREETSDVTLPLYSEIPAGNPSERDNYIQENIPIAKHLIGDQSNQSIFLLKVRGDSMDQAGILDGDIVIIDPNRQPKNYDIVAALVDGESTLKHYVRDSKGQVTLHPCSSNPIHQEIVPTLELTIQGIVKASLRKY